MPMFKKPAGAVMSPAKKVGALPVAAMPKKSFGKKAAPVNGAVKKAAARANPNAFDDDDEEGMEGIATGWAGAERMRSEHAGFANRLKMKEETLIGKFGNDEPYATVATHWLRDRKGKQSFICIGKDRCPFCAIGDQPRVSYRFNLIVITDRAPIVYSWEVGVKLLAKLQKAHKHPRFGPLSKMWYAITRSGLGQNDTEYTLSAVKRLDDIVEDYPQLEKLKLRIPTAEQMGKLTLYTADDVKKERTPLAEMQKVAAQLTGGEGEFTEDDDEI